jgi:hypothetical protein
VARFWEAVFALGFAVVQVVASDAQQLSQAPVMRAGSIRPDGLDLHHVTAADANRSEIRVLSSVS